MRAVDAAQRLRRIAHPSRQSRARWDPGTARLAPGPSLRNERWLRMTSAFQLASALGKRVSKSSRPTHSGVTVMRTIEEISVRSWLSQVCAS